MKIFSDSVKEWFRIKGKYTFKWLMFFVLFFVLVFIVCYKMGWYPKEKAPLDTIIVKTIPHNEDHPTTPTPPTMPITLVTPHSDAYKELQNIIAEQKKEIEQQNNEITRLIQQIKELNNKPPIINTETKYIEIIKTDNTAIHKIQQELINNQNAWERERQHLQEALDMAQLKLELQETQIKELEKFQQQLEDQQIIIQVLKNENKELKSNVQRLNIENEELKSNVQRLNIENKELKSNVQRLNNKNETLLKDSENKQDEITVLEQTIQEQKKEIEELKMNQWLLVR